MLKIMAVVALLFCVSCTARMHKAYRAGITMAGITALQVDVRQTMWALHNDPTAMESNPMYGTNPSNLRLATGVTIGSGLFIGVHQAVDALPGYQPGSEWLKDVLVSIPVFFEFLVVAHNTQQIGLDTWRQW